MNKKIKLNLIVDQVTDHQDYSLFHDFIKTYQPIGFKGIDPDSSLLQELEQMTEQNNQFFIIADMLQMKILFSSKRSTEMMGIAPTEINPYHFFEATHPDDQERHSLGRTKLFKLGQDFFISKEGTMLASTNLNIRNSNNKFIALLFQCYLFFSPAPNNSVYCLQIHTNVDFYKKIKKQYHYYIGNDLYFFKYPDEELLSIGNVFTKREFEIIKLIELGLNSEQIAEKLFVSHYTVNAHRANILKKTYNTTMSELIHDLNFKGML
jgi:DNA-binding CsgD family transcriptional regulator